MGFPLVKPSKGLLSAHVVTAVFLAACSLPIGFGDPLREVDIENSTPIALHVFQDGERRTLALDLAAHATAETAFAWPIDSSDGRSRMILAEDAEGKRVYCERFRFADLVRIGWKITLTRHDRCG
jgi:hypothetical protein